jgi:hypothetical protein
MTPKAAKSKVTFTARVRPAQRGARDNDSTVAKPLVVRTNVRGGGILTNHNERITGATVVSRDPGTKVNHNESLANPANK